MSINDKAREIVTLLTEKNMTVAFAESLTGGMISAELVSVPGASSCFDGSVVSYSNEIKHRLLEVDEDVLKEYGAVSEHCAKQMASGARKLIQSDIAVSVTGIAGPAGGSELKPVGTVYIGIATDSICSAQHFVFKGDRESVRQQTVVEAFNMVLQQLV